MSLQRRLIQTMLGLLALAALAGISVLFGASGELIGRATLTLAAAAIAIAASLPASRQLDRQELRLYGLIALLVIVVGLCLAFLAIWLPASPRRNVDLWMTVVTYCACAAPALGAMQLLRSPAGRWSGRAGIAFAALIFAVWTVGNFNLIGNFGRNTWDIWGRGTVLLALAAPAIVASLHGASERRRAWRWFGVGLGSVALLLGFYGIWARLKGPPTLVAECLILAYAVGASNLLLRVALPRGQRWIVLATVATLWVAAASASAVNVHTAGFNDFFDTAPGPAGRLLAASIIVTVCGLLAIAILAGYNRRVLITTAKSIESVTEIALSCPRCAAKQRAPLGTSRCPGCGLIFVLRVAEPHCARCDYTLLDLRSEKCPECGEPVGTAKGEGIGDRG